MRIEFVTVLALILSLLLMPQNLRLCRVKLYAKLSIIAIFAFFITSSHAADQLEVKNENTHGRLIMKFDTLPQHSVSTQNSIIVLSFDKPVDINPSEISITLRNMVMAVRKDPDGKAIRLAMNRKVKVNIIEAFDTLYVDLLPEPWNKPLPGLPPEAVGQLNKKLEEAAKKARDQALKDEQKRNPASVNLRLGFHATFTRMAFDWSRRVGGSMARDGETYVLTFGHPAKVDLSRLKTELPPQLDMIDSAIESDELKIRIKPKPGIEVLTFEEGATYVVDLMGAAENENKSADAQVSEDIIAKDPNKEQNKDPNAKPQTARLNGEKVIRIEDPAAKDHNGNIQIVVPVTKDLAGFSKITSESLNLDSDSGDVDDFSAKANKKQQDLQVSMLKNAPEAAVVQSEVRKVGSNMRILFPFYNQTNAAIFARGQMLWLLFESPIPIETRSIRLEMKDIVENIDQQRQNTMQIIRIQLKKPMLLSASSEANAWAVTLGDMILTPSAPLLFERANYADGRAYMRIPMAQAGAMHIVDDPIVGDTLRIITMPGPAQGMLRPSDYVEFSALATAHGAVLRTKTDDVNIQVSKDQTVISREMGLTISNEKGASTSGIGFAGRSSEAPRPGYIDFAAWKMDGADSFFTKSRHLINEASRAKGAERTDKRLNVARFYLANEMAEEALGVLNLAKEGSPEIERDTSFKVLRAVSSVYARRYKDALLDLNAPEFDKNPDVALWRGLAHAGLKEWRAAQLNLLLSMNAINSYPPKLQVQAMLMAARSSLEVRDVQQAENILSQVEVRSLSQKTIQEKSLLDAWTSEYLGNLKDARRLYTEAISPVNLAVESEARLRLVELLISTKKVTPEAAIKELDSLAMSWRGDEIELRTLSTLAHQFAQQKQYRRAFETMRTAVLSKPDSEITRLLQDNMQEVFMSLYLEDKDQVMLPIESLALFYDYKDLVPMGNRGDELIRILSNRLIDVELFSQAVELLAYQVDKRLSGAKKAEVAGTLALVHLMNREPTEALNVLRRSRQAVLSQVIERRRLLLEVSALTELGQADNALELLKVQEGSDIERIRADILWKNQKWQLASEALERLLDKRWQSDVPPSEQERSDILRTIVGYSLQGDSLGIDRFKGKFAQLMANSPDAKMFDLLSKSANSNNFEYRSVARRLANTDSLNGFLKEYKSKFLTSSHTKPAEPTSGADIKKTEGNDKTAPNAPEIVPARTQDAVPDKKPDTKLKSSMILQNVHFSKVS